MQMYVSKTYYQSFLIYVILWIAYMFLWLALNC